MKVTILGCGSVGLRLARLLARDHAVTGTTTRSERLVEIAATGADAVVANVFDPETLAGLFVDSDAVVFLIAPGSNRAELYSTGLTNCLDAMEAFDRSGNEVSKPSRFVLVTSTAVFDGLDDGEVVTEATTATPATERSRPLRDAECLVESRLGNRATIVRFSGLYSKHRGPFNYLDQSLAENKILPGSGAKYLNLIHEQDAARLIKLSLCDTTDPEEPGSMKARILHGCDGNAKTRAELYGMYCRLKGYPEPRFQESGSGFVGYPIKPTTASFKLLFPNFRSTFLHDHRRPQL